MFMEAWLRANFLSPHNSSVGFLVSLINSIARTDLVACRQKSSLMPLDSLPIGLVGWYLHKETGAQRS